MVTTCMVSLALFAVATAVPASYNIDASFDSCAATCKQQPTKFAYKTGSTYIYDYTVNTDTSMAGASEESAQLSIQTRAEIQVIDVCEFALQLKNVRVSHTDAFTGGLRPSEREDEFQKVLQDSNLRFSFDDGVISSVCPESGETTWALNFKRGLLTAFQNSMNSLDKSHKVSEVDVTGECFADFTVTSSWTWTKETIITKTKNLQACSKRDGYSSMYQIIPYGINSEIQSLPIMKGTHKCDYVISSSQVLQSASCEETHMFVPFSSQESGGKTKVQQKLTLLSQKDGVDADIGPVRNRLSLLFEHDDASMQTQNGPESLEQKLKEICDQTQDDIRPETPKLYSELVHIIKVLSKEDLERVYKLVKDKIICPKNVRTLKFFMDALPMAGTEGAISVMTTLINNKQVEGVFAKAWLTSIALVQEPTRNMVEDGMKLLKGPSYIDALLPVSALMNNFCKKTSSCESDYYISQILTFLQNKIPRSCDVDDKNIREVLIILKAVGNIGQSSLTSTLDNCISSTSAPLEVKVAAVDAYRRLPCDAPGDERDSALWAVLHDPSQDLELRITSYLSVMRCPDDDTLSQVSKLLEKDVVDDHLGGFIYSHVKNLKETSDPLKQDVSKAINLQNFKEFSTNLFKYSSNHEASILIKKLNLGFTADSNILMSSSSPLPRSAMLNLTVDLFGNSINLLEIGGRVEGLEILVEKVLGPTGYFATKTDKRDDDKLSDIKASIYARVFGNELFYEQTKGLQGLQNPAKVPNFLDILISFANRQAVAYTFSQQLMDVSLIVPTVAGLPLEIAVNGSMNLDLKAEGKADLRKVATSPRSMEIDGELRPSAALEITGTMAINALSTKMGLRMRNTMHSSTWLKGRFEINRGHILNIEIDPPGDKMEIFNARSQFFIVHDEVEKEQNMIKDNYQEYKLCSGDKLATVFGVELCGEVKFPNASSHNDSPYFPLTGPSSLSIMTFRRDTHTSYKLLAMRKETKDSSTAKFLMDTPNSTVNRMISTDITISYNPDKQIDATLVSPWKKLNVNSAVVANKGIISFVGSVLIDDKDKYGLTTEVKISKTGNSVAYSPFVELTQEGQTDTLLSGLVTVDLPNKLDANLEVKGLGMSPYNVEGGLINQEKEKRVSFSLNKEGKSLYVLNVGSTIDISGKDNRNVKVEPTVLVKTQDKTLVSITGTSDYRHDKSAIGDLTVNLYFMKPSSIQWKLGKNIKSGQSNYNVDLKVKSSILTGTIDGDVKYQKNTMSSTVKMNYNIPKFGSDIITWNMKFNNKSKNTFLKYILTSNMDMKKNADYNSVLNVHLDHKKKQTDFDVNLKYGGDVSNKKKVITINSFMNRGDLGWKGADVDFEFKVKMPEKNVDVIMNMSHSHSSTKLDSNMNLKFSPYMKNIFNASINLQDKSTKLLNYIGQASLRIMGKKFAVNSDLIQKAAKNFQHKIDVEDFDGKSHSINTVYNAAGSNRHEVISDISINGYKPIQLQGKTTLDPINFQALASAIYDKDIYNVSTQSRYTDATKRLNFALEYPSRQLEAEAEVKNLNDKVSSSFSIDWDAKRNSKSKISVESSYRNSGSWDSRVVSGTISVKTPFDKLEDLSAEASYSSDSSQYNTKGKVSWGGKQNTVASNLVVKRPFSLKNVEITFVATTPIRQYREIELEVNHKLNLALTSSVKGKLDDNEAELTVKGENRGDLYNRDFFGLIKVKTPFAKFRDVSVSLAHKDNSKNFKSVVSLGHNNDKFGADLQMDHLISSDNVDNNGKLVISWPYDQLQTTWQHSLIGGKQVKCSLESKWSGNKHVVIDFTGTNNLDSNLRHILATLSMQTPWRNSKNIFVKWENKVTSDSLESSISFINDRIEKIVYNIFLERKNSAGNIIFMVKSPLYDHKIHGQTKIQWNSYPMTALTWLEWSPSARIDFEGSLNAPSVFDIELNTKLITPFKNFENIFVGASHKFENSVYISQAKVSAGVRKMVILENRLQIDGDVKKLNTKLTSSYGVYSLDSSYKFDLPFQFDISLKTPYPKFDSLGLTAILNPSDTSLQSRLHVMYQLNKAVDSQLKLDWGDNFEGSFVVTTPFSNYENNKIIVRHDSNSNKGFTSHGEISVGGENVQGDATYTSSQFATSGSVSFLSSIPGLEKFSAIFSVKGPLNQMKADASLNMATNILTTAFTNNINLGLLKSSLTLNSPYIQDLKLSIQFKDSSRYPETKLESGFDGQYGDKKIDGKMGFTYAGLEKIKIDLSLNTPLKSGQISLENFISSSQISGKGSIKTDIETVGNLEASYNKNGPLDNMVGSATLIRNGEYLVKTSVKTNIPNDSTYIEVVSEGNLMPRLTVQMNYKGIASDFSTKVTLTDAYGNNISNEIIFKIEDSQVDLTSNFNFKMDYFDLSHVITMHKEGTLSDLKVDFSRKLNNDEITATLVFQVENEIKGSIEVNNLSSKYDKVGVEFEHSGDSEKFVTTGKVTISSTENISGKINFYRYNLTRIEASAELNTPWEGYRYSSAAYRHEGGDNRLSCNLNIQYGNGQKFSSDFITQRSSLSSSFNFNLKTPFKDYEYYLISGDFDNSKVNGKVVLGRENEYIISGVYASSIIQFQITTPLEMFKKATLNLKGALLDGTVDLLVLSFNDRVEGNGAFQYTNPYQLSLSTTLKSTIPGYQLLQLKIKNDDDSVKGKTSQVIVSWDPTSQVTVDARLFSGKSKWSSKQENVLELSVNAPFGAVQNIALDIEYNVDTNNIQTLLSLEVDQKKLVDLDVNFDTNNKYAYSAVIRKPWPMEYTTSYQYNDYSKEGDVYVNWNREDPYSNVRIKCSLQNRPSDNDNSVTLTVITPLRTIGVEHSMGNSVDKFTSSGKLYWNQDDDSKLSYSVDIRSSKYRKDTTHNGDFKLGFLSRTLGLSGSLSNNDLATTTDAVISWDLGRDDSKHLQIQATLSGQDYTKADISVKLPSNLQVDSALILNQGNTILDGKTDISFSRDSRKTLTLFSKLSNTPKSYSYFSDDGNSFNYSVELGVSHPDTQLDMKIDSHVASSDKFLTSSLGIHYMTIHRQMKNLALFAEIDKIRKQISFVASGPTNSAGVSGKLVSDEPLSLIVLGSLNGQEKLKSTLDVDISSKTFKFDIGQPDSLLSLKAYYPNSSTIQTELFHQKDNSNKQEAAVVLRLLNPNLLHSSINWRPAAVGELGNFVTEKISMANTNIQGMLTEMNEDLRTELNDKYEQVTSSFADDLTPLLNYVGDEAEAFATDFDNVRLRLAEMHRDNVFFIQDISNMAISYLDYTNSFIILIQDANLPSDDWLPSLIQERMKAVRSYILTSSPTNQIVIQALQDFMSVQSSKVTDFIKYLQESDLQIMERAKNILSNVGILHNNSHVDFLRRKLKLLRDDYGGHINNLLSNSIDLKKYSAPLFYFKDAIVTRVIPKRLSDIAEMATNELYEQVFNQLNSSVELLKDIIEYELLEYINQLTIKCPVTLFDPKNGKIEATFALPVEMKNLDTLPDLSSYTQGIRNMYKKYEPYMNSISQYLPQFTSKAKDLLDDLDSGTDDNILANLDEFKPSKSWKDRFAYKS